MVVAPWYVDIFDSEAAFGSGKSCGYNTVLRDWFQSHGLVVRPFFMIQLNATEINKTVGNEKFREKGRKYYAIPTDVLKKLSAISETRSLVDHGLPFIDHLCGWRACMCSTFHDRASG